MWFVFALYNYEINKVYIGQTGNLERRIEEHNLKEGNHFTAKLKGKWTLIYSESLLLKTEALRREKQLKSFRGRQWIKKFIPCSPPAGGRLALGQ